MQCRMPICSNILSLVIQASLLLLHYLRVSCDSPSPRMLAASFTPVPCGCCWVFDLRSHRSRLLLPPPPPPPAYCSPFIAVISHSPITVPLFILSYPGVGKSCLLLQVSLTHAIIMTAVLNHSCALSLPLNAAICILSSPTTAFNRFMT